MKRDSSVLPRSGHRALYEWGDSGEEVRTAVAGVNITATCCVVAEICATVDSNRSNIRQYSVDAMPSVLAYFQDFLVRGNTGWHQLTRIVAPKVAGSIPVGHPPVCRKNMDVIPRRTVVCQQ